MPLESVNDFVIRFANVNGSGSASANQLFAHAILRMGVPVAPRNIFPSNIQGLPTWYEVRVSQAGHLGARGGVDLMVAMNPQTWDKDVAAIEPGGYLFYDATRPVPKSRFRDDINVICMPLTEICFFFQAEDGIRDHCVTGVQTCALPICSAHRGWSESDLPRCAERPYHARDGRGRGRSEERRVGKECRNGRAPYDEKKKYEGNDSKAGRVMQKDATVDRPGAVCNVGSKTA